MAGAQAYVTKAGRTFGITVKKQIIPNIVTGAGLGNTIRAVDNIFGSPLQRLFSVPLPFIGNTGVPDFINYLIHSGGFKLSQNGLIAVLGDKAISGTLPLLSNTLPIPGLAQVANPNVRPTGPGAPI